MIVPKRYAPAAHPALTCVNAAPQQYPEKENPANSDELTGSFGCGSRI